MNEPTPILRADALDDNDEPLDADFKQATAEFMDDHDELLKRLDDVPVFAEGGIVEGSEDGTDALPEILSHGCEMECYENGTGGWSYRPVVR